jgi:hypothetical protein
MLGMTLREKRLELIVFSSSHGNQLLFRHSVGTQHIFGALGADHGGAGFEGDVRNVQDVVVMSVSDENKICPLNVRIDGRHVRHGDVTPAVGPPRIPGHAVPLWRRWTVDSRQIWIDQDRGGSVGDFPARSSQVFQNDLIAVGRLQLVLGGKIHEHSCD